MPVRLATPSTLGNEPQQRNIMSQDKVLTYLTFTSKLAMAKYVNSRGIKKEDIQHIVIGKDIVLFFWIDAVNKKESADEPG